MECETKTYARDGKMESPGGAATVPARRVSVIRAEMVAQWRVGVKVKGCGLTLPLSLGAGISPNTRRILWTPDRLESSMTLEADASAGRHDHATRSRIFYAHCIRGSGARESRRQHCCRLDHCP